MKYILISILIIMNIFFNDFTMYKETALKPIHILKTWNLEFAKDVIEIRIFGILILVIWY